MEVVVFLVAFVVGAVILRRLLGRDEVYSASPFGGPDPAAAGEIDRLIENGRLPKAVKLYQRLHHVSVEEARAAIEERARRRTGRR